MIKDEDYFMRFDLTDAAEEIKRLGRERGASDVFGDAIMAIGMRSERGGVSVDLLVCVLGQPDRVRKLSTGDVYEYEWSDYHGPDRYRSATPFLVVDGRVCGLATDDDLATEK